MRATVEKPPSGHNSPINRYKKAILTVTLVLVTIIILHHIHDYLLFLSRFLKNNNANIFAVNTNNTMLGKKCNIFRGIWVPYLNGPYYTNESGCVIEDAQNCMKYGRPDDDFMKWRWKPDECELPLFNAPEFFEIVREKSMVLVGDSLARNQMQSLQCLLSSVARPVEKTDAKYPRCKIWVYPDYNFTLALVLTTHLVKNRGLNAFSRNHELYVDEVEVAWADKIKNFNYVVISSGHWFSRPLMFYEKNNIVGCNMCMSTNITKLSKYCGYRKVFRTAFRTILDLKNFKGIVILRTITPSHFEVEGPIGSGNCVREKPYKRNETKLDWDNYWMFYLIQVDEFFAAQREGKKRGLNFRLLDITDAMRPRADGHPNHYGDPPEERFMHYSDCLHWCLPGAIDLWNELLLQMLKAKADQDIY